MTDKKTLDGVVHLYVSALLGGKVDQAKQATADMVDYVFGKDTVEQLPALDMCDQGHPFYKLPNHPQRDGKPRCVYCLAIGFDKLSGRSSDI